MITRIKKSVIKFIQIESSSSIVLGAAAIAALIFANSSYAVYYHTLLNSDFFSLSISHWINDGLMAVFFFLVGLEIKKEIVEGELNSIKKASLPVAAALGGMLAPALIYLSFNRRPPENLGWGIPIATDIAFALGVLSIFGKRIPSALKVLLLAVAIVDDLGAIIVIALFYTSKLKYLGLGIGLIAILVIQILKYFKVSNYFVYFPLGIILWFGVLYSGVHATIAGVILGLLTPIKFRNNNSVSLMPAESLIKALHIPVSFLIMPIFAFANAGVGFNTNSFLASTSTDLFKGILLGLVVGKPVGVFLFSYMSCKLKFSNLPTGLNWSHILVLGNIAGIGFTMSLFIAKLALSSDLEQIAKLTVLVASTAAIIIGVMSVFFVISKKKRLS